MDIRKLLGTNLIRLRGSRTQAEVAESCGFEIPSYSRWENGKAWASSETIETLAAYYEVDASELYRGETAQKPLGLPVSKTLQKLMAIPDKVYDFAQDEAINAEVWEIIEDIMEGAIEDRKLLKLPDLNKG
jgi:transcriptional regulator with XRE-family HTH domain